MLGTVDGLAVNADAMVRLWRDVLKMQRVDVSSDFFDIGGTSLDALRLSVEIGIRFGVRLDIADFFDSPTVGELAKLVTDRQSQARAV